MTELSKVYDHLGTIKCAKQYCNEDISLIENYNAMIADSMQKWCCHHRREIDENKSYKQLINEKLYYKRPATELIFMKDSDHKSLHMKGKQIALGRHQSEAAKLKIREASKSRHHSEATKTKIGDAKKGMKWWNDGTKNVRAKECPGEGFIRGQLRKVANKNCNLCISQV